MNQKIHILIWFLLFSSGLYAQSIKIEGKVIQSNNSPISGITISEQGTNNKTQSNDQGAFTLNVQKVPTTLVFTGVGYSTKRVSIDNSSALTITLDSKDEVVEEVVVVGYQRQSAKKTTSAVQVISGKDIENLAAPSFESMIQGRVSGVNIQSFTGEPGARNTFTVRGNTTISPDLNSEIDLANTMSSPLYIIDGMPMSISDLSNSSATGTNAIAGININDIESIVVQKDAAATAVWGSRGANGVIVIKTKAGKSGKPQIRLSYYKGLTERPELQRTLLGTAERRAKMDIIGQYANFDHLSNLRQGLTDSLNTSYNNATDWQDLFYTSGNIDNIDGSIAGGTDIVSYRVALGYYNEGGVVRNTGFKRYSLRSNFGFNLASFLRSDLTFSLARMERKRGLGRGINQVVPINQGAMPSSFVGLGQSDYDYYYGQYDKLLDDNKTDILSIFSKTYVDIIPGLQYSFEASAQANLDRRDIFQPKELNNGTNFAQSNKNDAFTYNLANVLNYNKTFNEDHTLTLTGIQSFQYDNYKYINFRGENIPTDDVHVISGVAQKDMYGFTDMKEAGLISYLGQFAYDFKSKYIFNASYRADASSRFGKNTKWGYFPSASVAWLASEEEFLNDLSWLNFLKFRGSWGQSGTLPTDFYAPYNVWSLPTTTYGSESLAIPSYDKPLTLDNLTWNKSEQTNIGFDLRVLNDRLTVTFDAYRKITKDPILSFPYPSYTGYTRLSYNVPMEIYNEGIDLTISTRNLSPKSNFQWNTNLNLTFNKNTIGSLPFGNRSFYASSYNYNQQLIYRVGSPIYQWAQVLHQGVYNHEGEIPVNPTTGQKITYFKGNQIVKPGYPHWQDVNADFDVWDNADKGAADGDLVPTGNPNPRVTGGIYNEFNYKNFSFGILGTFTLGRDIINTFKSNQFNAIGSNLTNFTNNRLPDLEGLNYWTPEKAKDPNYQADFPSIAPFGGYYYQFLAFSSMFNENGNYFKIKTLTAGYTLPQDLIKRMNIGLRNVRIYGMMDNVLQFKASTVPDAELVTPQGEYSGGAYPLPKKFTLGLEVNF